MTGRGRERAALATDPPAIERLTRRADFLNAARGRACAQRGLRAAMRLRRRRGHGRPAGSFRLHRIKAKRQRRRSQSHSAAAESGFARGRENENSLDQPRKRRCRAIRHGRAARLRLCGCRAAAGDESPFRATGGRLAAGGAACAQRQGAQGAGARQLGAEGPRPSASARPQQGAGRRSAGITARI